MRTLLLFAFACLLLAACKKQTDAPAENTGNTGPQPSTAKPSSISVLIKQTPMTVTAISYNRSSGTFNFTAQNSLQKLTVNCFHFYQQSRWSYMFSDSITYSTRPDTLTAWYTRRANNWGTVDFAAVYAPLTDSLVKGTYSGDFTEGKEPLTISGDFYLVFK